MLLEFLAALVTAVACAGLWLIARKVLGERLPRWSMPAAAALGLISFTVWSEYSWFSRVSAQLPDGVKVISAPRDPQALRPWTFLAPLVTHFAAVDTRSMRPNPQNEALMLAQVYAFARWRGMTEGYVVVDCAGSQSVMLTGDTTFDDTGTLVGGTWTPADAALLGATCGKG